MRNKINEIRRMADILNRLRAVERKRGERAMDNCSSQVVLEPIKEFSYNYGKHSVSAAVFPKNDDESIRIAKALERAIKMINFLRQLRGCEKIGYTITAFHYPTEGGTL